MMVSYFMMLFSAKIYFACRNGLIILNKTHVIKWPLKKSEEGLLNQKRFTITYFKYFLKILSIEKFPYGTDETYTPDVNALLDII